MESKGTILRPHWIFWASIHFVLRDCVTHANVIGSDIAFAFRKCISLWIVCLPMNSVLLLVDSAFLLLY